jgi:hypothetical protein
MVAGGDWMKSAEQAPEQKMLPKLEKLPMLAILKEPSGLS